MGEGTISHAKLISKLEKKSRVENLTLSFAMF